MVASVGIKEKPYLVSCQIYISPENKYRVDVAVTATSIPEAKENAYFKLRSKLGASAGFYAYNVKEQSQ